MRNGRQICAAVTMAYQDYYFLEKYVGYYSRHIGRENIFIFSHGNDPRHRDIARGANVMALPCDPGLKYFDRRRWFTLSLFSSALKPFYDWTITSDVDELVILDPAVGDNLGGYLETKYPDMGTAPKSISPFALELVHSPEHEPAALDRAANILAQRRIFRPSANYSKPCLTCAIVRFSPGGHVNNLGPQTLADDLYLLHLRFFDQDHITSRLKLRADQVQNMDWITQENRDSHSWVRSLETYRDVARLPLLGEDIRQEKMRALMLKQRQHPKTKAFGWGRAKSSNLYTIPERFASVI